MRTLAVCAPIPPIQDYGSNSQFRTHNTQIQQHICPFHKDIETGERLAFISFSSIFMLFPQIILPTIIPVSHGSRGFIRSRQ